MASVSTRTQLFLSCVRSLLKASSASGAGASANRAAITSMDEVQEAPFEALIEAVEAGDALTVRHILDEHPAAALEQSPEFGDYALHVAATHSNAEVAGILAAAAPAVALMPQLDDGNVPLHEAARHGHAAVARLLVTVAPAAALVANDLGSLPLHVAAERGDLEMVLLLAEAAPEAAQREDFDGHKPLDILKIQGPDEAIFALFMLGTTTDEQLEALHHVQNADLALPRFAEVVAAAPLTADQWSLVPVPCPALAPLLPAVHTRSLAEAGLVVQRLPAEQHERLRCAALSLARVQRVQRAHLPQDLTARILCLALS